MHVFTVTLITSPKLKNEEKTSTINVKLVQFVPLLVFIFLTPNAVSLVKITQNQEAVATSLSNSSFTNVRAFLVHLVGICIC
jgi:hypothetical protein